ncbi:MAG: hypothetical protein ABIQ93_09560 [Saprospiraceae bacterium]
MKRILCAAILLAAFSMGAFGQGPDGSEINKAIPIYFGQTLTNIGDSTLSSTHVYRVVLARGQKFGMIAKLVAANSSPNWILQLVGPSVRTVGSYTGNDVLATPYNNYTNESTLSTTYQVPAAGEYFIFLWFRGKGVNYSLQVNAEGTPIAVPNPTSAGCLNGRVDSILYSLQYVALGLPDEVTIGGQRACATCTVKPPLYPEISNRLEGALRSGINVEACYDSAGRIFQLKLLRQ